MSRLAPTRRVIQSSFCFTLQAPRIMQCRHRTQFQNSTDGFLNLPLNICMIEERENIKSHILLGQTVHSLISKLLLGNQIQITWRRYVLKVYPLAPTRWVIQYSFCSTSQAPKNLAVQTQNSASKLECGISEPASGCLYNQRQIISNHASY